MKLCVAFFGIPRGYRVTVPPIQRFLQSAAAHVDVAVRYHLFKIDQVDNPRSGEKYSMPAEAYDWLRGLEGELQDPADPALAWIPPLLDQCADIYEDGKRSLRNLLLQLHSLQRVTAQIQQLGPDVVAFLRPDLLYHAFPGEETVRAVARHPTLCLLPAWQWWGGLNDRFALCGRRSYVAYGSRLDQVPAFLSTEDRRLHGEWLLLFALRRARVRVRSIDVRASRVREENREQPENFDPVATLGVGRRQIINRFAARLPYGLPWPLV